MSTENQWLSVNDVAEILQVKAETVRRWIRRDEIPVLEVSDPRMGYRIRREDLNHFIWQRYRMRHQPVEDQHFRQTYQASLEPEPIAPGTPTSRDDNRDPAPHSPITSRFPGITWVAHNPSDTSRKIVFISPALQAKISIDADVLKADEMAWWRIVHPDDVERVSTEIATSSRRGTRFAIEYRLRAPDGDAIWVRDEAVPSEDGAHWQGVIQNITERKRVELTLQERLNQHAMLAEFGDHALQDADIDTLMNEAVEYTHTSLNVDFTKVLQLLPGGNELRLRAGVGWDPGMVNHTTVSAGAESQAGYTLLSNEPVIVDDLKQETRFNGPPLLRDNGVRSGISVIIAGHGMPWGVLGAHTRRVRNFTREDVYFLQSIANILAAALRSASLTSDNGRWLSIRNVAESLQVKDETVRRWIRRGELPIIDLGSSRAGYRIHPADLEQFINDRYIRPNT